MNIYVCGLYQPWAKSEQDDFTSINLRGLELNILRIVDW
jgi:hypothetical protein